MHTKNMRFEKNLFSNFRCNFYFLYIWGSSCTYICIPINRQNQHISTSTLKRWKCQLNRLRDIFKFHNILYAYSEVVENEIIHIFQFIHWKILFTWIILHISNPFFFNFMAYILLGRTYFRREMEQSAIKFRPLLFLFTRPSIISIILCS